jgi:hypothetical protein
MPEQAPVSHNGRRAERECGCPPWVRCVHFEGQVLWLVNRAGRDQDPATAGCPKPGGTGYAIGQGSRVLKCDRCGAHSALLLGLTGTAIFPDLPAAEAEFRAREAALLERVHV